MTVNAPARLLAEALAHEPARPLVTFYDDATGERTELSVVTFDNWVAKTANLMVDGLGLGAGSRVSLLLPLHWQNAVWLAACWSVGATTTLGDRPEDAEGADLAVCGPATLAAALGAEEVVALSLRPLAGRFLDPLPGGVLDYAVEVPGYGDRFVPNPGDTTAATTQVDGTSLTGAALVEAGAEAAARWGLGSGGRLLTAQEPHTLDGLLAMLPAALVVGGSVVLSRNPTDDLAARDRRTLAENITATAR